MLILMIKAENIVKSFGNLTVLKGVTVEIPEKKVIAIVGPSGAGKTTLLQILGTLSNPDSGSLKINGEDIFSMKDKQMARFRNQHIGFVFQFHHLLPEFTAIENVCMPALIANVNFNDALGKAKDLLDFLGLSQRLNHKPSELSGGEQQRVAVARALINNPIAVLADEPSGNLDSQNKEELHKLFFKLRDKMGQTFVIVTHDLELAHMADMQLKMNDGKIL